MREGCMIETKSMNDAQVALETTGGKPAEWSSDGEEEEEGSRRDIHLSPIGVSGYQ